MCLVAWPSGTVPDEWGGPGRLPYLRVLDVSNNLLKGTLPASWFQPDAFPQLAKLDLSSNYLSGALPAVKGSYLQANGTLILWPQLGVPGLCGGTASFTVLTKWGAPASVQMSDLCPSDEALLHGKARLPQCGVPPPCSIG
jgi:hypothetical protein